MSKVFVIGSINMDLVISAPYLPKMGETISGGPFITNQGGKGANQAVALSKMGCDTYLVGCVGNTFKDELLNTLNGYGVKTDFVEVIDKVSSGVAIITIVNGDNSIILDPGANNCVSTKLIDKALATSNKNDYVVLQQEIPEDMVMYALKASKEKGLITILNPAPARKIDNKVFNYVDYFIPNQHECEFYSNIFPNDDKTIKEATYKLQTLGIKNVLITLGSKGSIAISKDETIFVEAHKVKAIDTTAAGDTYCGALVAKLIDGCDLKFAMEFASRASAITVTREGAAKSIPYLNEVK